MKKIPDKKDRIKKLVKQCDDLCREIVFVRDKYTCQRCGSHGTVQWCHYLGRAKFATRWDLDNVHAFCCGCHRYFDEANRPAFTDWIIDKIGRERHDRLRLHFLCHFKKNIPSLEVMRHELQSTLMMVKNLNGGAYPK